MSKATNHRTISTGTRRGRHAYRGYSGVTPPPSEGIEVRNEFEAHLGWRLAEFKVVRIGRLKRESLQSLQLYPALSATAVLVNL